MIISWLVTGVLVFILTMILVWFGAKKYEFNPDKFIIKLEAKEKKELNPKKLWRGGYFWFGILSFLGIISLFF